MACTHGSQKKATTQDYEILTVGDIMCALYGQSSVLCAYASGGLGQVIPNAIIHTPTVCASPPSPPTSFNITDFLTGQWIQKAIDIAQAQAWSGWCECKPPPSPPPPFNGGQCQCSKYQVKYYYKGPALPGGGYAEETLWGEIVGIRIIPGSAGGTELQIKCRGGAIYHGCGELLWRTFSYLGGGNASNLGEATIVSVTPLPGESNNCGNPPSPPPGPAPQPDPVPPPPLPPPELPTPPTPHPCIQCPPGPPGPKGDKGDKGDSGEVEIENVGFDKPKCDNGEETTEIVLLPVIKGTNGNMKDTYQALFDLIGERSRHTPCLPALGNTTQIDSGTMTLQESIKYVAVTEEVKSVFLVLSGNIPTNIQLYKLAANDEYEGKFGHIGLAVPSVSGRKAYKAERAQDVWSKYTFFSIPETRLSRFVRISLKPGLTWALYDSGER